MSSPFKTSKEFLEAKGPIYSFNGSPVISFFLVIGVIFLLWFIYASYTMKTGKPKANNPVVLSLLIAASVFSLAESIYMSHHEKTNNKSLKRAAVVERMNGSKPGQGWQVPMATVGMMLTSRSIVQRRSYKSRRSFQHSLSLWENLSRRIRAGLSLKQHSTRTPITGRSKRTR